MPKLNNGALTGERYRVIVSTDIGGTDPDDFQSMVHYLLYADVFDTEALISSPFDMGRASDILDVIDQYEKDYPNLSKHSETYPTPEFLRSITKQGEIELAPFKGYRKPTDGSRAIIESAKKDDDRPVYVLIWGSLEDLAQALHDEPSIKDKLRVYYIGGPNKKWGVNSYEYIRENFPDLWFIENNSTYRGWFVGGKQTDNMGNETFVTANVLGHGALGDYFAKHLGGVIKMGDTPTVAYMLNGTPATPENPSWGGQFAKVGRRPKTTFTRNTTKEDVVEIFEIMEFIFDGPDLGPAKDEPVFKMVTKKQKFDGYYCGEGKYKMFFMPKTIDEWSYVIESDIAELNGMTGEFISVKESQSGREGEEERYPNWWSDVLDESLAEGDHKGAITVSMWREEFLRDFQERMDWCQG